MKKEAQTLILTAIQGAIPAPYNKIAHGWTNNQYQSMRRFVKNFLHKTELEFGLSLEPIPSHDPREE